MSDLAPFSLVDAALVHVAHEAVASEQAADGSPRTGSANLGEIGGAEVGIWEMTAGSMRDIEVDEIFIVIAGEASVTLFSGDRATETIALHPGVICRLTAGMSTMWTVPHVLRKVYILG